MSSPVLDTSQLISSAQEDVQLTNSSQSNIAVENGDDDNDRSNHLRDMKNRPQIAEISNPVDVSQQLLATADFGDIVAIPVPSPLLEKVAGNQTANVSLPSDKLNSTSKTDQLALVDTSTQSSNAPLAMLPEPRPKLVGDTTIAAFEANNLQLDQDIKTPIITAPKKPGFLRGCFSENQITGILITGPTMTETAPSCFQAERLRAVIRRSRDHQRPGLQRCLALEEIA